MEMYEIQRIKLNEKMLKGLKGFHKGLVEHGIILRSKKKNQTFDKTIKKEIDDMDRFQKEIYRIEDPEIRELIRALTEYACAFYKLVEKEGIENYKDTIEFLDEIYSNLSRYDNIESLEVKELIEALTKYVVCFNRLVEEKGSDKYKEIIDFVSKFYFEMDNKYYSELEGKSDDMKQLAEYLNEIKI